LLYRRKLAAARVHSNCGTSQQPHLFSTTLAGPARAAGAAAAIWQQQGGQGSGRGSSSASIGEPQQQDS